MDLIISHVVAMSNNQVIGVNNDLPWNLKDDLAHFKKYTTGKIIVMGRKTYESIGRPLPNRVNYVISSTLKDVEGISIFANLDDAIESAKMHNIKQDIDNEVAIIGGGYLFRDSIDTFNKLVLTRVDCSIDGDVYYPEIDFNSWELDSSESFLKNEDNQYDFSVETYRKLLLLDIVSSLLHILNSTFFTFSILNPVICSFLDLLIFISSCHSELFFSFIKIL